MNIESFIYTIACAICGFTLLLVTRHRRGFVRLPPVFLCVLSVVALRFVLELLIHLPDAPLKGLWLGLLMFSALLVAPLMYQYAHWIEHGRLAGLFGVRGSQTWLLLAGFLCVVPLISRAHMGTDYHNPAKPISADLKLFINTMQMVCAALFAVQAPLFLQRAYRVLQRLTGHHAPLYKAIDKAQHNALRYLVLAVMATWIIGVCRVLHCWILGGPTNLSLVMSGIEVSVVVLALSSLLRPDEQASPKVVKSEPKKYQRSALDATTAQRIRGKIERALEDEALLTDNRLNLQGFCTHINESSHYVSQVINQEFAMNFFTLINTRRAELACLQLTRDRNKPVSEIAETLGFNSKSTFNSAFKQLTLMTPSQYRQHHQL